MKNMIMIAMMVLAAASAQAQFLWKISGNGLSKPSYLLGTMHIAPTDSIVGLPAVNEALDNVSALVCELDVTDPSAPQAAQAAMMRYGIAPEDSTLSKVLPPLQFAMVEDLVDEKMGPMATTMMLAMDRAKPLVATMMLGQLLVSDETLVQLVKKYGVLGSIDEALVRKAKARALPLVELESMDEQMQLLMNMSIRDQADNLVKFLDNPDSGFDTLDEMLTLYLSGDIKGLERLFMSEKNTLSPTDNLRIFGLRNSRWLPRLEEAMRRQPVLIAVGAGHLVTPEGLLPLLRKAGYTLTPVKG